MKIRTSFVSNSSSSSFIVRFPEKPTSIKKLMAMMFPGKKGDELIVRYDHVMSVRQICKRVFSDIKKIKKATKFDLLELFSDYVTRNGYYYPNVSNYNTDASLSEYIALNQESYELREQQNFIRTLPSPEKENKMLENIEESKKLYKKMKEVELAIAEKKTEHFLQNKNGHIYILSYADEDGEALLEHGDIFENVDSVTISQH